MRSAGSDDTGRWGVARLVAQREAERRAAQEPADHEVAVPGARRSRAPAPREQGRSDVPDVE
ncbi:MAG: hypothetical protein M3235_18510, partial [Actinomycetota bacterium]|nr:hypothetical protein [Actinomycetota bacterium]